MNRIHNQLFIIGMVIFAAFSVANADTRVEKDELKALITGKTLEGKWIVWDSNYRMYLAPSGDMKRVYGKGTELTDDLSGTWMINKKGKLCFEVNNMKCRRVKKRDDGGYNLYNKRGEVRQTIEKITDGNPYNLK